MQIDSQSFGKFYNQPVHKIRLENDRGMAVEILELGGIITSCHVPNAQGEVADVVLGFDDLTSYVKDKHYFGAMIGRVANRIEGATYELAGETVHVDGNAYDGRHCVHSGRFGYHRRVWRCIGTKQSHDAVSALFSLDDGDGEEGFRNSVHVTARYELTNDNYLSLTYDATADGPTPISLTAHSYFNLAGHQSGTTSDHTLTLFADHMLEQREDRLPSGVIAPVAGTDFAFQSPRQLGAMIDQEMEINHSYVVDVDEVSMPPMPRKMARLEAAGRSLEVWSNELTLHYYNGHNLDGVHGKAGALYKRFAGVCLEPKGYVNGVNEAAFPCHVLDADGRYHHRIEYRFNA